MTRRSSIPLWRNPEVAPRVRLGAWRLLQGLSIESDRLDLARNACYLDYLRGEPVGFDSKDRGLAVACISAKPGISLDELLSRMASPAAVPA
jgi:hypothetical protein